MFSRVENLSSQGRLGSGGPRPGARVISGVPVRFAEGRKRGERGKILFLTLSERVALSRHRDCGRGLDALEVFREHCHECSKNAFWATRNAFGATRVPFGATGAPFWAAPLFFGRPLPKASAPAGQEAIPAEAMKSASAPVHYVLIAKEVATIR